MLIELAEVWKIYQRGLPGEVQALAEISLTIAAGEMICLRGPSGSGKTSLLALIGGIIPPTSGLVRVAGHKLARLPDQFLCRYRRQFIGFISQHGHLLPELTVEDNIGLPLYPLGLSPSGRRQLIEPLLQRLAIGHRRRFAVADLSGGECQRVAICRALILDPPIIIADEPTAHLDADLATTFLDLLGELKQAGKTVVLSSHDPRVYGRGEIDRILTISDGRLVAGDGGDGRC